MKDGGNMEENKTIREEATRCLNAKFNGEPFLPVSFMDFIGSISVLYCYVLLSSDYARTDEMKNRLILCEGDFILSARAKMYMNGFLLNVLDRTAENEDGLPFPYFSELVEWFNDYVTEQKEGTT